MLSRHSTQVTKLHILFAAIRYGIDHQLYYYYFGLHCARPGESEDTINPKTPTPHNQPMEGRKR